MLRKDHLTLLLATALVGAACSSTSPSSDASALAADATSVPDAATAADVGGSTDVGAAEDAHVHGEADSGIAAADAEATDAVVAGLNLTAEPHGSPARRGMHVHVRLERDGVGVPGATVTVSLWMPEHGHGAPAPAVEDEGEGDYHLEPTFTMPGRWEVRVAATVGADMVRTVLEVDVP
jgi:hypothetical protein